MDHITQGSKYGEQNWANDWPWRHTIIDLRKTWHEAVNKDRKLINLLDKYYKKLFNTVQICPPSDLFFLNDWLFQLCLWFYGYIFQYSTIRVSYTKGETASNWMLINGPEIQYFGDITFIEPWFCERKGKCFIAYFTMLALQGTSYLSITSGLYYSMISCLQTTFLGVIICSYLVFYFIYI